MGGCRQVSGELIFSLDAVLQNPPEEIPRLVAKADEGYDVVGTVRQNRQDSWFRKTASKMINRLIQRTTGKAMGDYGCMLRAYRRHIVDAMLHCHERSTFIPILANICSPRPFEFPIPHSGREFGKPKSVLLPHLILVTPCGPPSPTPPPFLGVPGPIFC
ncbi:glycosyltransferase, partial [Escherichia coli]|nr:glycosyltransferase [Escherichia coli]